MLSIEKFFQLDRNDALTQLALSPPSCGGGPEFKDLALHGDIFLKKVLVSHFNILNIKDSGEITQLSQEFHNHRTLVQISKHLLIHEQLHPTDKNQSVPEKDMKEAIESLIEVSRRINGDVFASKIILNLYEIAVANDFLDENWIKKLNEYYQNIKGENPPSIEPEQDGGVPHLPLFKAQYSLELNGEKYEVESGVHKNKDNCRRETAWKMLRKLKGEINEETPFKLKSLLDNSHTSQEILRNIKTSLSDQEITFKRANSDRHSQEKIHVTTNTGEKVLDWVKRKARKNPFGMLTLLSAHLNDVSGISWSVSLESGELTLMNISLGGKLYFEIGFGESKTKSKKEVGQKMIEHSKLYEWMEENHPNTQI